MMIVVRSDTNSTHFNHGIYRTELLPTSNHMNLMKVRQILEALSLSSYICNANRWVNDITVCQTSDSLNKYGFYFIAFSEAS